ncbi:pyridoxal-5'-phosphate-dependent protein [Burkholderia diffusa]|nr:pyridoxal-5'-phosphate-dependent protein [Burkholderia diffusa]
MGNFLPAQYEATRALAINHNYLGEQFAECETIFEQIREVVRTGDFTLGRAVDAFEEAFAAQVGTRYAIGVGSGTDALRLALMVSGVGAGDEVITTPYTFYATAGAIVTVGARPVFVDVDEDYNLDVTRVEAAITPRTAAIVPVHWSGRPCRMDALCGIAARYGLAVVEDAAHAIGARSGSSLAGAMGDLGCFSLHPLKNLNVWGDGGVITTDSARWAESLRLLRNHGLADRNTCEMFALNSRLDTIQAVVAHHLLGRIEAITQARIANARRLDEALSTMAPITVPPRAANVREVFHLYCIRAERRDALVAHLITRGIDAKVHYPVPLHLQPAARSLGYQRGDFPCAEAIADSVLSLPVHEFIDAHACERMVDAIAEFYR